MGAHLRCHYASCHSLRSSWRALVYADKHSGDAVVVDWMGRGIWLCEPMCAHASPKQLTGHCLMELLVTN